MTSTIRTRPLLALFAAMLAGTGIYYLIDYSQPTTTTIVYSAVRPDEIEQVQDLVDYILRVDTVNYMSQESLEYMLSSARRRRSIYQFKLALDDDDKLLVAARDGNKIVGMVFFKILSETVGYLDHLYVLPEYFNRGIGSRLIDIGITFFKHRRPRAHSVSLITREKNKRSQAFYKKRGFVKVSEYTELDYKLYRMMKIVGR